MRGFRTFITMAEKIQKHSYEDLQGKHIVKRLVPPIFKATYNPITHSFDEIIFQEEVPAEKKTSLVKKALAFVRSHLFQLNIQRRQES